MGYWAQVRALILKDFQVMQANKVSTVCEFLIPVFCGTVVGLFILLISIVQRNNDEWKGTEELVPINIVPTWVGFTGRSAYADALYTFLNFTVGHLPISHIEAERFSDLEELLKEYKRVGTPPTNVTEFIGIEAVSARNWTFLNEDRNAVLASGVMLGLGAAMYDPMFNISGPMRVEKKLTYKPIYVLMNLRAIFSSTAVMFLLYAFIPSLILTAGRLVEDKRQKIRESLKVMGLYDSAYLFSNFVSSFIRFALGTSLIAVIMALFGAIDGADVPAVWLIALMFAVSLIAYAQIMPSLFSAPIWSNVFSILLLGIGAAISSLSTGWQFGGQLAVCFLSPCAFYYSILPYMSRGTVHLFVTRHEALIMIAVDTILYLMIGNYIYAVSPGEFGVPKHPLFMFKWIAKKLKGKSASRSEERTPGINDTFGESARERIVIRGLTKYFGEQRETPAVDNFSISIHRGEVFALLGHNGAGKTTTISMLTGMITPTDYKTAKIDGLDLSEDMDSIRRSIGLCPQFDVLFNDLTARQHLQLFARIKSRPDEEAAVNKLMTQLELPDTLQKSATYSGGTKRRLSVANALIGDAGLIFLDEPSSGMDPMSRRKLWDLLKEERSSGKTLLLTTHFMEEADYLGDRIAIMSRGRLFCCDTSTKLKQAYGVGYYLTLVKNQEGSGTGIAEATKIVSRHIPEAALHHESTGDVTYLLPIAALPIFGPMLVELEGKLKELGFHSYGISMNTLEDVFVSISEKEELAHELLKDAEEEARAPKGSPVKQKPHTQHDHHPKLDMETIAHGTKAEDVFRQGTRVPHRERVMNQIKSVFWRKAIMLARTRRMQLMIFGFPLLFILSAFVQLQPSRAAVDSSFNGKTFPDYNNLNLIFIDLRNRDENQLIRDEFAKLYHTQYPNATLNWFIAKDYNAFSSGAFIPLESVSFITGFKSPEMPAGFLPHDSDLRGLNGRPYINYTFLYNKQYAFVSATQMLAMFNAAVESVSGNRGTEIFLNPDTFGASNSSEPNPWTPPKVETTYQFTGVGIYTVISLVQVVATCVIPIADEMQRRIYHTCRAHGTTTLAYFLGNILFDFLCCLYPLIILFALIFIKGIGSFESFVSFWLFIAGLLFCVHAILLGYNLVCFFDQLKPVTYIIALHGSTLAMMGAPYLLWQLLLAWKSLGVSVAVRPYLESLTPSAAFYLVMDDISALTSETTAASKIMTLRGNATGLAFVFLVVEMAIPLYFLHKFGTRGANKSAPPKPLPGAGKRDSTLMSINVSTPPAAPLAERHEDGMTSESIPLLSAAGRLGLSEQMEDHDVTTERKRVENEDITENMAAAKKLRKDFGLAGFDLKTAVNCLSIGLRPGECFGLLGPNGAGKTTTCKLFLKELNPTSGSVLFPYAVSVTDNASSDEQYLHYRLGVCQQHDTLWEFMSAREHMEQYLKMRLTTAYKESDWRQYITDALTKVQLAEDNVGEKGAGGFSGGMKRKLIVSLAMYTGALSVFLDEPSSGMDPFARRALWKVIAEALASHRCVLLTTHSMEEADAVCSRIAIMTAGRLQCIGNSQHLKNRFGSGYVVTVTLEEGVNPSKIEEKMAEHFGLYQLLEVLGSSRRYGVGKLDSLAAAFNYLETQRKPCGLQQYSVSQTSSLEQIFLNFVGTSDE